MANDPGRPEYTKDQYEIWLTELKPFLERGKSLYKSIELAGLISKKTTIYDKYRSKDWFAEKITSYQMALGETINDTFVSLIEGIAKKVKLGEALTDQEAKLLTFGAEKHRSAQQFFVNRFETAKGKPIEEIIEQLETENDNIDDTVENIEKIDAGNNEQPKLSPTTQEQVVETNTPVQNQEQAGAGGEVPTQPDTATPPATGEWS